MTFRASQFWLCLWLLLGAVVLLTWTGGSNVTPWRILSHTILLATLALSIAMPLGLWCAHRWIFGSRWERWLITPIVSLAIVPLCLQVAAWESVLGKFRAWVIAPGQSWEFILSNWCMAAWIHGVNGASWLTIFFVIGFWTRGWALEQQALLDATSTQVFLRITLVRMRPVLLAAALWMLVLVAREIAVTDIYQIGTYAQYAYLGYALDRLPWPTTLPESQSIMEYLGVVRQVALVGWLISSALWAFRLVAGDLSDEPARPRVGSARQLRAWQCILTTLLWAILFLAPLIGLVDRAGTNSVLVDQHVERHFSLMHLWDSVAKSMANYRWPGYWSFTIGLAVAVTNTCLSGLMAWIAVRRPAFARWLFLPLIAASMTVPYPIVGILVDSIFSTITLEAFRQLWDRSILGPVIACTIIGFGPVALMLYLAMRQSSKSVAEIMMTERVGPVRMFMQLGFAANRRVFAAALGISFLIAVGDVACSFQVLPAGIDTAARSVLGQLHSGVDDLTAAVSLTLLLASNLMAISMAIFFIRIASSRNHFVDSSR